MSNDFNFVYLVEWCSDKSILHDCRRSQVSMVKIFHAGHIKFLSKPCRTSSGCCSATRECHACPLLCPEYVVDLEQGLDHEGDLSSCQHRDGGLSRMSELVITSLRNAVFMFFEQCFLWPKFKLKLVPFMYFCNCLGSDVREACISSPEEVRNSYRSGTPADGFPLLAQSFR